MNVWIKNRQYVFAITCCLLFFLLAPMRSDFTSMVLKNFIKALALNFSWELLYGSLEIRELEFKN
jgi:hypothetical protein